MIVKKLFRNPYLLNYYLSIVYHLLLFAHLIDAIHIHEGVALPIDEADHPHSHSLSEECA